MDLASTYVQQALTGDRNAFDELVKIYLPNIYRYLLWITHNSDTAQDIAQEAFIRAWQNLKKFDSDRPFKPWLLRIARNCAYDHLRKKTIIPFSHLSEAEEHYVSQIPTKASQPQEQAANNEQATHVQAILDQLAPKYREVLILHYLEELAAPEIADVLNLNHETVRTRLRRARTLFRETLTAQDGTFMPLPKLTPQPHIAK